MGLGVAGGPEVATGVVDEPVLDDVKEATVDVADVNAWAADSVAGGLLSWRSETQPIRATIIPQ